MGALHDAHFSLVRRTQEECDFVVLSIFVNPLQFGPEEDFDHYPRQLEMDMEEARKRGVDLVFTPTTNDMYPDGTLTNVRVSGITNIMCGASRSGHFDGVATVVAKLLNIVQPDAAYFGLKDAQQVAVIEKMVHDLNIAVQIRPCPTIREPDGLATSSRNVYLSPEERKQAPALYQGLQKVDKLVQSGQRDVKMLKKQLQEHIESQSAAKVDYVEIRSYPTLGQLSFVQGRTIVAAAVHFGRTRLIDNIILDV
jgi:pantoate--beta-alanine ligase